MSLTPPIFSLPVNVRTFGAEGDGVHNDSAAVAAALAQLAALGGGTLVVPPGLYVLDSPPVVPGTVTLDAAGAFYQVGAGAPVPWAAATPVVLDAQRDFKASGSALTTTGTITAGSTQLTVTNPQDFADGQGIFLQHAGNPCANPPPEGLTVSVSGTAGTTSYTYAALSLDDAGGYSASTAYVTITNGPATLSSTNYNVITVTPPSSNPNAPIALYGGPTGQPLVYCTSLQADWYGYTYEDNGLPHDPVPSYLPATLPASGGVSGQSGWLRTTIVAGGGTGILTLADAAITSVTGDFVAHDDTAALNAFTAALTTGAVGYIPPGHYNLSDDLKVTTNGVTLRGVRYQSVLSPLPGTEVNCINLDQVTDCVVEGIYIAGNAANVMPTPSTRYKTGGGIVAFNATDITIQHCDVDSTILGGFQLHACTGVRLIDCHATNCKDNGIFGRPGNTQVTVLGCSASGGKYSGIAFIRCTYVQVIGSRGFQNGPHYRSGEGAGIDFEGCQYSSIVGCESFENGVVGINLRYTAEGGTTTQDCTDILVMGNVVRDNAPNTAPNGQFMGTTGIVAEQSDRVVIANNYVAGSSTGIAVGQTAAITITGNQVTNNQGDGIQFYSPATAGIATVSGNQIWGNTGDGINLIDAFNDIQISGNKIWNNGVGGSAEGVNAASGSGHQIIGNVIFDNTDNGVLIGSSSVTNVVVAHNIFGNSSGGTQGRALYEVSGAGPTAVVNNWISGQTNVPYYLQGTASYASGNIGGPPYPATVTSLTLPASGSPLTNTTNRPVRCILTGGTVSAIAVNGVTTGLTAGVFDLQPAETLTVTYSAAPTLTVQGL